MWMMWMMSMMSMRRDRMMALLAATSAACLGSCVNFPTAAEAGISYATEVVRWPAELECLNSATPPPVAKEVLDQGTFTVVIAGGDHAISDAEWPSYMPSWGHSKNSDRHLLFGQSCFWRSPRTPASCVGDDCRSIVEFDQHSWVELSKIHAVDCVPSTDDCSPQSVKPGQLAVIVTEKCHELVFVGDVVELAGPGGERAIMHATADGVVDLDVALPAGWSLTQRTLTEPLVLHPYGGGDGERCFYNIIRDHQAQSYHQVAYPRATYP